MRKKNNPRNNGVQLPFLEPVFIEKWQEWLQYRKERRLANYVPTGLKQTFTKLINDSNSDYRVAIQIIDQSISNNWQGLFPVKLNQNARRFEQFNTEKPQPTGTVASGGFGQL